MKEWIYLAIKALIILGIPERICQKGYASMENGKVEIYSWKSSKNGFLRGKVISNPISIVKSPLEI
jgi:hypothetical protein